MELFLATLSANTERDFQSSSYIQMQRNFCYLNYHRQSYRVFHHVVKSAQYESLVITPVIAFTFLQICFHDLLISLGRVSAAARFLGLQVRTPPWTCLSASCECYVLSGRGFCDGPITRPEEFYRVCMCQSQ